MVQFLGPETEVFWLFFFCICFNDTEHKTVMLHIDVIQYIDINIFLRQNKMNILNAILNQNTPKSRQFPL